MIKLKQVKIKLSYLAIKGTGVVKTLSDRVLVALPKILYKNHSFQSAVFHLIEYNTKPEIWIYLCKSNLFHINKTRGLNQLLICKLLLAFSEFT